MYEINAPDFYIEEKVSSLNSISHRHFRLSILIDYIASFSISVYAYDKIAGNTAFNTTVDGGDLP